MQTCLPVGLEHVGASAAILVADAVAETPVFESVASKAQKSVSVCLCCHIDWKTEKCKDTEKEQAHPGAHCKQHQR